jgi:hypothetical protein
MKKFIAAFDGLEFSQATMDYALYLARQCNAHLVGVFLEDRTYHSYQFSELVKQEGGVSDEKMLQLNRQDKELRDRSVELFEAACAKAGMNYTVHRDRNVALQELLHESVYADLILIDSKETFNRYEESMPTRFMKDLLADVKCPVLTVPGIFVPIDSVVLLYDGEPTSVHAIKMFSYISPGLKDIKAEVLSVKSNKQSLHLPDHTLMKEYMKRHYPNAEYVVEKGDTEEHIISYLKGASSGTLVVLGAYQRGRVSRWFKASTADFLMRYAKVPLFIAHN